MIYVRFIINSLPASKNILSKIEAKKKKNHICKILINYCIHGWLSKNKLKDGLLPYFGFKDNILYAREYVLYNSRLIILSSLQLEMLNKIHSGYLGISKCRAKANQSIWWIRLSTKLKNIVEFYPKCVEYRSNNKEPFIQDFPSRKSGQK